MSPGLEVLVQEPCFSPRYPGAPEGDGFLITMIDNVPKLRNEVVSFLDPIRFFIFRYDVSKTFIAPGLFCLNRWGAKNKSEME